MKYSHTQTWNRMKKQDAVLIATATLGGGWLVRSAGIS
jgi:hypothetical protein